MTYYGKVIHGNKNGRKFGFPTANILLNNSENSPEKGIYAVQVTIGNKSFGGMLYVGTRPTLNLNGISIEINIFDFNDDIYDEAISFEIVKRIRDDQKFPSIDQLIAQLQQDKIIAQQYVL
ncbi:riboflavin kinase [Bacteroidales bacterium OttesenSCG-928-B11]|nr:riboflavin kinase [Bacteroidales bacterium OttesenSCG-928-C03]MDL2312223.1 riboflavin kinase [Bacteroidales bacterium OttesenSCG-928-B11]MDL2326958.1 riboflavin kinase [Bacteroidales bacterium OttesenSCG-928-A14]